MLHLFRKYIYMPFVDMSFRSKLFLVFVLVTILPMTLLVYFSFELTKSKLTDQIYINMMNSTAQINKNLENKLDSYEHISASIYLDNRLTNYLTSEYQDDDPSYLDAYKYIGNRIDTVMAAYPDFDSVFIYSDNSSLPKDNYYIRPVTPEVQRSELYKQLLQSHGNIIHLPSPQTKDSPAMFTLARLLNNNSNQYPYGILVFRISESVIYSLMEKEAGGKDIFIMNDKGVILSAADKQLLNASLPELLDHKFDNVPSGRFDTTYKGNKSFAVYNTLKNGWKTVSIFPYESIIKDATSLSNLIIKISLAFIGVALLLIFITASMFSKRIRTLIRMVRRIERGNFTMEEEQLGSDEIGQLHFAFKQMAAQLNNLINEVYHKELQGKDAELDLLQAQINPHFLYNTLGSISSLAAKHSDTRIQDMVLHLAKFYRISLNKGKSILTINEEIKLTQSYNAIQLIRFKGQLNITYSIDETILPYSTVKLTLQPFIENAVIHAIWTQESPLNIHIKGRVEGNDIILSVIDDGMGMRPETLKSLLEEQPGRGYGISNVNRRIKLKLGEYYGVNIYSRLGIGTTVQIRLPQKMG